jgi:hypothetical protein
MLKRIRHSKKAIVATVLVCTAAIVTMTSSRDHGKGTGDKDPNDINQHPPIAENVVTQLKSDGAGGNVLLEIKFRADERLRANPVLEMVGADGKTTTLHDDGKNGDGKAGDFVFASFISEDVEEFVTTMESFNKQLAENKNNLVVFEGRLGSNVRRDEPFFNREKFLSGEKIEISKHIFSLSRSSNPDPKVRPVGIKVERREYCRGEFRSTGFQSEPSIEITPFTPSAIARGYGPPPPPIQSCYTIKKEHSLFITDLGVVEDPARTFNPCTETGNPNGAWTFKTMMDGLANGVGTQTFVFYWIDNWIQDLNINGEVVKNRAQKTIDMIVGPWISRASGGSIAPSDVTIWNWRELWFQQDEEKLMYYSPFKLTAIVNRGDLRGNGGYNGRGRNVSQGETRFIFSAINITKDKCGVPIGDECFEGFNTIFEFENINFDCNFATQWINLSKPGLVLGSEPYNEMLEKITRTVTDINAAPQKPNGSAINQVRTNEIALTNTVDMAFDDRSPRWQLREFKIQNNPGLLDEVTLNNQPAGKYNGADGGADPDVKVMADWVNNFSFGATQPVPFQHLGQDFKGGKINYPSVSQFSAPGYWDGNANYPINDPDTRHQFSLNTCDGCHGGEVKTIFTHANAVGLGTQMRYVGVMDYITDGVDTKTQISPFLTGRTFNFAGNNFDDDDNTDAGDNTLVGFFRVNDPTGNGQQRGFNDLERRLQDLANFVIVNRCCKERFSRIIRFAGTAFFQPLNMSH